MPGVRKQDCKFYVDETARIIVCVISNTQNVFINFIETAIYDNRIKIPVPSYADYLFPTSINGKAKCAPEDEWDEEYGRELAFSRAKAKYYHYFFRYAENYISFIERETMKIATRFDAIKTKVNNDESENNDE